jgi:hypothetical protein
VDAAEYISHGLCDRDAHRLREDDVRRLALGALLFFYAFTAASALAADGGDPSKCYYTIKEIQIRHVDGRWVSIFQGEKEIETSDEEAVIKVTNRPGFIPEGRYENIKISLSETIRFAGHQGPNYSKEGGSIVIGGSATLASEIDKAEILSIQVLQPTFTQDQPEGLMTEKIDMDYNDRDDITEIYLKRPFLKPAIVKDNSVLKVDLTIDFRGRVFYAWKNFFHGLTTPEIIYLLPPREVAEVSLSVDGASSLATKETLEWAF